MLNAHATLCALVTTSASAPASLPAMSELLARVDAGELLRIQAHRRQRRGGAIGPERIEGIVLDGLQRGVRLACGLLVALDRCGRRQPRVVAEHAVGPQVLLQPFGGRNVAAVDGLDLRVDLIAHLQRVASVDEDGGAVGKHDCEARRAGEACEPCKALGVRGHVFVLVFVGARNDEAVEPRRSISLRNAAARALPWVGSAVS